MTKHCLAALLLGICACNAWAVRVCGDGDVAARGVSPAEDPIENRECALTGRMFCRLAEDRQFGLDQKHAVQETAGWFKQLGRTGSHAAVNYEPMVAASAEFVYRQQGVSPLSLFYQAVYACGAKLRLAKNPQPALLQQFGAAATKCQQQFPDPPGATSNDSLRNCLLAGVDRLPLK